MGIEHDDMETITKSVATIIREYVQQQLASLSGRLEKLERIERIPAESGSDGKTGERGERGPPGKDAEPLLLDTVVGEVVKLMPTTQKAGRDGKDGKGVSTEDFRPMFEAEHAKWTLEFERRANDIVRRFLEKLPKPADGKDGLGFDDLTVEHDGERLVTMRFQRGDELKEFTFDLPAMIYRTIWKVGKYKAGDVVTWGGSAFIAKRDTESKPEVDESWQLIVKRGRDGKDGEKGPKGDAGQRGEDGKDMTQMGPRGEKW